MIVVFNRHTLKIKDKEGDGMCKILKKLNGLTANELLDKYRISSKPPIDLEKLLVKIGINVRPFDFGHIEKISGYEQGDILGAAISEGDNISILYNRNNAPNRQIFTIAHELGHCCLHSKDLEIKHIELRKNGYVHRDKKEIDANIFAGEILIPQKSLMKIYKDHVLPSISYLSSLFKVSKNVMTARLDYLNLPYFKDN